MEIAQLTTKKGVVASGDTIIYSGNFAILQQKVVEGETVVITHLPFDMKDISSISRSVKADKRELLKEEK